MGKKILKLNEHDVLYQRKVTTEAELNSKLEERKELSKEIKRIRQRLYNIKKRL